MAETARDFKAQVLDATDIVELISQTVALKRRGKDYVGLCPFHQEKSPSFHVSPTRQFFHCYGCKAGGNAIDFVMKRDRVDFLDAMRALGERVGLEYERGGREQVSQRQVLLDAHRAAGELFEKQLNAPVGAVARDYLAKRGFNAQAMADFRIGFAPDSWDTLRSSIVRAFGEDLLVTAGLLKQRDGGTGSYDTFRNRLIFPIRDEMGRCIAFGGRILPGDSSPAKYLNSPETPLFSKSRCLFGIDQAKQAIVETRTAIVVEGYTDVVMAHQFDVKNVVSVLGTALTDQHIQVLKRFADRIVLLFDADVAGDTAADKAVNLFLTQPIEIHIASMPAGVDPDEFLQKHGAEGFRGVVSNSIDALEFKWRQLSRRFSRSGDLTDQQQAVSEYLELLASARGSGPVDAIRWGGALARVSRLTEIPVEQLNRRFANGRGTGRPKAIGAGQPSGGPVVSDAVARADVRNGPAAWRLPSAAEQAERWILAVLLVQPNLWNDAQQHVHVEDFTRPELKRLAEVYWEYQRDEGEPEFAVLLSTLKTVGGENSAGGSPHSEDLGQVAIELLDQGEKMANPQQTLQDAIGCLSEIRRRTERTKSLAALRRTDAQEEAEKAEDEIQQLRKIAQIAAAGDLRRI